MTFDPVFKHAHCLFKPYSPVWGRMVGAITSSYAFDSVVSGQNKYKSIWTALTDKTCKCTMW